MPPADPTGKGQPQAARAAEGVRRRTTGRVDRCNDLVYIRFMRYTWNPQKNRRNIAKHGIDLVDAARVFEGPVVEQVDEREDYGEVRIYAIGQVEGRILTVVYTDRKDDERRIISAWRAESHEQRLYWQCITASNSH